MVMQQGCSAAPGRRRRGRWNHNIHYHAQVLSAVPAGCDRVLDIGCGEGMLARKLRSAVPRVCGIDRDLPSLDLARAQDPAGEISFVCGDVLAHPFVRDSFGMITCVAALHHMDAEQGLSRLRGLLQPGGTLAVVGLARSRYPADLPRDMAAVLVNAAYRLVRGNWDQPSPVVWPPPETYATMRRKAERVLPGASFRRHLLWRYTLIWVKPAASEPH